MPIVTPRYIGSAPDTNVSSWLPGAFTSLSDKCLPASGVSGQCLVFPVVSCQNLSRKFFSVLVAYLVEEFLEIGIIQITELSIL